MLLLLWMTPVVHCQSFLTADYPSYTYQVKARYQQAFFDHMPAEEAACGIYNISAIIPFDHTLSGIVNIPVMADYSATANTDVRVGNIELGLDIINPKWKHKSSVVTLSFVIPFSTQNIYNRENINGDFSSLTERACITDYSKCQRYLPGTWSMSILYNFHFRKGQFQMVVGAGTGIMARKTESGVSSTPSLFFQPAFRAGYTIDNVQFTAELLDAFYLTPKLSEKLVVKEAHCFVSTLGISYSFKDLVAGIHYQLNLSHDIKQYATHIIGIQCKINIKKQEKYLKPLEK